MKRMILALSLTFVTAFDNDSVNASDPVPSFVSTNSGLNNFRFAGGS